MLTTAKVIGLIKSLFGLTPSAGGTQLLAPAAGVPNISVAGDTDTGLWLPGPASGARILVDGVTYVVWNGNTIQSQVFETSPGRKAKAADQTVTDSATFVNDTHLSFTLPASRKFNFIGVLFCTSVATSGVKIDFEGGTATATNFVARARFSIAAGTGPIVNSAALATDLGSTALVVMIEMSGNIEVNAAGTFILRFAQNAETAAAESITLHRGSWLELTEVP